MSITSADLNPTPMSLHTGRLILRPPAAQDWSAFRDFYASDRSAGVGGPKTEGPAWRHFAAELGHWQIHGFGMWAVTQRGSDECLGMIGPWCPADWPENEVGWMIFSDAIEGTGIATEAARAAIAHAFGGLGWDTVVSYVAPDNTRSARLAEKLGAELDPNAPVPAAYPETLVYRHPKPGVAT